MLGVKQTHVLTSCHLNNMFKELNDQMFYFLTAAIIKGEM